MKSNILELMNQQITHEFYSAYLYLDFACIFEKCGLKGFSTWFRVQAKEELCHGMLFIHYLTDCGEDIHWQAIEQPVFKADESRMCETILEGALQHEQYITHLIETIYAHAESAHDLRTMHFLDWFIDEQGEEEKNASDLIRQFKLYGHDASSLFLMDEELGKRKFTEPDAGK